MIPPYKSGLDEFCIIRFLRIDFIKIVKIKSINTKTAKEANKSKID